MLEGATCEERTARVKAQKYEIVWCVLGAVQVIQHGWEQKIQKKRGRHYKELLVKVKVLG